MLVSFQSSWLLFLVFQIFHLCTKPKEPMVKAQKSCKWAAAVFLF